MSLISKSREELQELAKECGLKITFDNPPEKCGVQFMNEDCTEAEFIHFDKVFNRNLFPFLKEDEIEYLNKGDMI